MKSELGGGQTKDDVETVEVTDSVETVEEVGEATEKVVEELKEELKVEIKKEKSSRLKAGKTPSRFSCSRTPLSPWERQAQTRIQEDRQVTGQTDQEIRWCGRRRGPHRQRPRSAADFTGPTGSSLHHARSRWSRL